MMEPKAPTEQELAQAREAKEIADGHRYQTQEFRDAREALKPGADFKKAREAKKSAAPKKNLKDASPKGGERIAKVLARAGLASRREIERLVGLGKIAVNGRILETPAVLVSATDVITVDGQPIGKAEPTRLWRYHKPVGLMTTHSDPQGRPTVFEKLPQPLPRVISVGRLDMNSEGLLLLTNDGELARALEMPTSGWVRRYRARALGNTSQAALDKLQHGTTVEGVIYGPMEATLDKKVDKADGRANVWLTVAITEGKNREVRKVLESIGLKVNRLIRLAYGPFQLGNLEGGEVEEVGPRVIRELLADKIDPRNLPPEGASQTTTPRPAREEAPGRPAGRRGGGDRFESRGAPADKPKFGAATRPAGKFGKPAFAEKREYKPRDFDERPRFEGDGEARDRKPYTPRPDRPREERPRNDSPRSFAPRPDRAAPGGDFKKPYAQKPYTPREGAEGAERKPFRSDRPQGERSYGARSDSGDRKPYVKKAYTPRDAAPAGEAGAYERAKREFGGGERPKRDFGDRPQGDRPAFKKPYAPRGDGAPRSGGDRPAYKPREGAEGGERKTYAKPYRSDKPAGERTFKPREDRAGGERKAYGDKPRFDRGAGGGASSGDGFKGSSYKSSSAPRSDRPASGGGGYKSSAPRSGGYKDGGKPSGARPGGSKPGGFKPGGGKPGFGAKPRRD